MAQYFDFRRLVKKYSTTFIAIIPSEISPENRYDDMGRYVESEPKRIELVGAILSHRQNKIFKAGGTITEQDKALYMLEPLENSLKGAEIIHESKRYSIGSELNNAEFTGVWAYNLKYCSAFDKEGENG